MKKLIVITLLFSAPVLNAQSVFGYWYGNANVKTRNSANNYLLELILLPEKNYVKGVLNYYFRDTYRSIAIKGNYQADTRQLSLYEIPVAYHGSFSNMEVECVMNMLATLKVAQAGSELKGAFVGLPDYKYTCPDVNFTLTMQAEISKVDSVLKALAQHQETYQVWKPSRTDTLAAVSILQRKVINYVIEREYTERQNDLVREIEVESDSIKVDFYDNGQVDGDSISVFFNKKLTAFHQRLSTRSVHFDLVLDSNEPVNELSMFADNLGTISPNTALMMISDGHKRYAVTMQSNLEKNATVRIKRRTTAKARQASTK